MAVQFPVQYPIRFTGSYILSLPEINFEGELGESSTTPPNEQLCGSFYTSLLLHFNSEIKSIGITIHKQHGERYPGQRGELSIKNPKFKRQLVIFD